MPKSSSRNERLRDGEISGVKPEICFQVASSPLHAISDVEAEFINSKEHFDEGLEIYNKDSPRYDRVTQATRVRGG